MNINHSKTFLVLLFITVASMVSGQTKTNNIIRVAPPVCYASGEVERASIPPPAEIINGLKSASEKKSEIIVNYNNFPENAKLAFEYAVNIWELIVDSDIPIYVHANWTTMDDNVLGSCGPDSYLQDFKNTPHPGRFYPIALAEKLSKTEITGPDNPDIVANFNKSIDWYFGTHRATPDSLYDFATVVLHEMGHGLGFTGFFFVTGSQGSYGYSDIGQAAAFDLLVINSDHEHLVDTSHFTAPSSSLKTQLTSGNLYANSPAAAFDGGGLNPRLYSPITWDDGSSVYHLNDATYPSQNINSLMTHAIGKAEAVHDPGPLTMGIMDDIGWKHLYLNFEELKDIETSQTLQFNVKAESDYDLDSTALFIVYSTDEFQSQIDSLPLVAQDLPALFTAELIPTLDMGTIHYYISAEDIKNRKFTLPIEAPKKLYSLRIGPDNELPEIQHDSIPYFLLNGEDLKITANIDDNLGIDSVIINYNINGIEQTPFSITKDSMTVYSGVFNFDEINFNDGDSIEYEIVAIDASVAKNKITLPAKKRYSFKVEQIFEPVPKYINTFNSQTADFVISDFEIYTARYFDDDALHSPHPYPSSKENNVTYNFSTILKHPVIIQENGTMTFDEVVLVEPGEPATEFGDDEFWDFVIVEGSTDTGRTWLPLEDGYDSRSKASWYTRYNELIEGQDSQTKGNPDLFVTREINLLENGNFSAGDTILIRFRLFSDPYAYGWGWAIDNIRIQVPVSSPVLQLSPGNISLYPNPFSNELYLSIEVERNLNEIQLEFYNAYGQKVKVLQYKNILRKMSKTIDINDLSDGLYLVSIRENGQQISTKKIIKKTQ